MPEYMYDIILKTEIGDKKGQLALKINQNIVEAGLLMRREIVRCGED